MFRYGGGHLVIGTLNRFEKQMIALRYWLMGSGFSRAKDALEIASELHNGKRRDGSEEFSHQLAVTHHVKTLTNNLLYPEDTLIISLFHDSVEDDKITLAEISEKFGDSIADCISNLSKFTPKDKIPKNLEFYYSMIARCPKCSIVKGVDRVHNLDTMVGAFTNKKKWIYLEETETGVLPMLKQARKKCSKQELAYQNIKYMLESQVKLLHHITLEGAE